nr:copia protein [Tanacetum cinerariifolium]
MAKQAALTKSKEKGTSQQDDPHKALKDKEIVDNECSRQMTGNKAHLADYQEFKGGFVAFGGSNGRITGKGTIKAGRLDFEDVYYVEELKHYNLFSVSQMCDKKNKVLFTDTDCLMLSLDFKLHDEIKVYNLETKRVEENLHVNFLENKPNVIGKGHAWMFDLDYLKISMNYEPVSIENQPNKSIGLKEANNSAGTQVVDDQGANLEEIDLNEDHFVMPVWSTYSTTVKSSGDNIEKNEKLISQVEQIFQKELENLKRQEKEAIDRKLLIILQMLTLTTLTYLMMFLDHPSVGIFTNSSYDDEGVVTDFNNLEITVNVSPTPITRIHTIHPKTQILRDHMLAVQTRSKVKENSKDHALFQIQKVWILVDLPFEKKYIETKWVYRNKKDERGVIVKNKARLLSQGHMQEEGIDYDEVFSPVARIEAIRIFLAFASYMGFIVYQMDVKSAFLYGTIDEEVYVTQPPGFVDPKFPNKVYKVVKALYGLHQAPRACVKTASTPIKTHKPLVKDEEAADVDVYLYRYLKGQPKLGLWYPKVSSFDLEAYSDSDYTGANLDRKSTTREAEYVAAAHYCGQVL